MIELTIYVQQEQNMYAYFLSMCNNLSIYIIPKLLDILCSICLSSFISLPLFALNNRKTVDHTVAVELSFFLKAISQQQLFYLG